MAFVAADFLFSAGIGFGTVLLAVATLAAIGAVVGAIHGLSLVWLLRPAQPLNPAVPSTAK